MICSVTENSTNINIKKGLLVAIKQILFYACIAGMAFSIPANSMKDICWAGHFSIMHASQMKYTWAMEGDKIAIAFSNYQYQLENRLKQIEQAATQLQNMMNQQKNLLEQKTSTLQNTLNQQKNQFEQKTTQLQNTLNQQQSQQQTNQQTINNTILQNKSNTDNAIQIINNTLSQQQTSLQQLSNHVLELHQQIKQFSDQKKHKELQKQLFNASYSNLETVKARINGGAQVNEPDSNGTTALHIASYANKLDIVKFLLVMGAKVDVKDKYQRTPAHRAALKGNSTIIEYLLESAPGILNETDYAGNTMLHIAAQKNNACLAAFLVKKGANLSVKNSQNQIPQQIANNKGYGKVLDVLM